MLLSSFSADAVCQHGTSLPCDRSSLFLAAVHVRWPTPFPHSLPCPPLPFLPRQARRLLSCLVETAPLRLARSAAVRAQLRLPGTHVARFHLWVSVWPQEWVDIRMLMHANAYIVTSTRVRTDEQHTNTQTSLNVQLAQHSPQHTHSPVPLPFPSLPPLSVSPCSPAPLAAWHPSTPLLPTCF